MLISLQPLWLWSSLMLQTVRDRLLIISSHLFDTLSIFSAIKLTMNTIIPCLICVIIGRVGRGPLQPG